MAVAQCLAAADDPAAVPLWCDDEFPAENDSVGGDLKTVKVPNGIVVPVSWRRAPAITGVAPAAHERAPRDLSTAPGAGEEGEDDEPEEGALPLYVQRPSPLDVQQGNLGDCWLLSALAVAAERPELIEYIIVRKGGSPWAIHQFRFCLGGLWRIVTIDDRLPVVHAPEHRIPAQLIFTRGRGHQMYVPLLEKAMAKVTGSYAGVVAGTIGEGLRLLTGRPVQTLVIKTNETEEERNASWRRQLLGRLLPRDESARAGQRERELEAATTGTGDSIFLTPKEPLDQDPTVPVRLRRQPSMAGPDMLWARLLSYEDAGYAMGLSCDEPRAEWEDEQQRLEADWRAAGLQTKHAYSLLGLQEVYGARLLRIRNPWGKASWKGSWGAGWDGWTPELRDALSYFAAPDGSGANGIFFMTVEDCCKYFATVTVCECPKRSMTQSRAHLLLTDAAPGSARAGGGGPFRADIPAAAGVPCIRAVPSSSAEVQLVVAQPSKRVRAGKLWHAASIDSPHSGRSQAGLAPAVAAGGGGGGGAAASGSGGDASGMHDIGCTVLQSRASALRCARSAPATAAIEQRAPVGPRSWNVVGDCVRRVTECCNMDVVLNAPATGEAAGDDEEGYLIVPMALRHLVRGGKAQITVEVHSATPVRLFNHTLSWPQMASVIIARAIALGIRRTILGNRNISLYELQDRCGTVYVLENRDVHMVAQVALEHQSTTNLEFSRGEATTEDILRPKTAQVLQIAAVKDDSRGFGMKLALRSRLAHVSPQEALSLERHEPAVMDASHAGLLHVPIDL